MVDTERSRSMPQEKFFSQEVVRTLHNVYADGSIRVFQFAEEEARRFGHPELLPEHLLLGIIREGGQEDLLQVDKTSLERVRNMVRIKYPERIGVVQRLRVSKRLSGSMSEVREHAHWYRPEKISPQHIFAGIFDNVSDMFINGDDDSERFRRLNADFEARGGIRVLHAEPTSGVQK